MVGNASYIIISSFATTEKKIYWPLSPELEAVASSSNILLD